MVPALTVNVLLNLVPFFSVAVKPQSGANVVQSGLVVTFDGSAYRTWKGVSG